MKDWAAKRAVTMLLILAALLRLPFIWNRIYGTTGETFRDLNVVIDMFRRHLFPLVGPTASVGGFHFGAIYYYLLAPFLWLCGFQPAGAVLAVKFFNLLFLWMAYRLVTLWFNNPRSGLVALILLTFSIFDIQNSYSVSNVYFLPFFVTLFFYYLTIYLRGRRNLPDLLWLAIGFGVAVQLHATALFLLPVILVAVLWYLKPTISAKDVGIFWATQLVLFLPYIVYQAIHRGRDLQIIGGVMAGNVALVPGWAAVSSIANFWGNLFFLNNQYFNLAFANQTAYYICLAILTFMAIAMVLIMVRQGYRHLAKLNWPANFLLLSWLVAGSGLFLFYANPKKELFYFLILWPIPVIVFMVVILAIKNFVMRIFVVLIAGYIFIQTVQLGFFYQSLEAKAFQPQALAQLFRQVRLSASSSAIYIAPVGLDQNILGYYLRVNGLAQAVASNAEKYYMFVPIGLPSKGPAMFKRAVEFSNGDWKVVEYRKE